MDTEQVVREIKPIPLPPSAPEATVPAPEVVEPPQPPVMKTCACGKRQFQVECGFFGSLDGLSEKLRGEEKFNSAYPFSRLDILENETCLYCAKAESSDGQVVSTTAALFKMSQLIEKNARALTYRQEARWKQEERERAHGLIAALKKPDCRGFVNQTLAEASVRKERHKKGRQYKGGSKVGRGPGAPKNYGTEKRVASVLPSKNKKKKGKKGADGGDDQKKGGKRGKGR